MMMPSHLLAALLLGLVVSQWRRFSPRDWALALGFSVAIDLDHTLQFPVYVATHGGLASLSASTMIHWGANWQGFMHTPWALVPVAVATLYFRSWIPGVFWGLHMVQDFVVADYFVVFGSWEEWLIIGGLALLVTGVLWLDRRRQGSSAPLWRHGAAMLGHAPKRASPIAPAVAAAATGPIDPR